MRWMGLVMLVSLGIAAAGCGDGEDGNGTGNSTAASADETARNEPALDRDGRGSEASIEEFGEEAAGAERAELLATFDGYLAALAARDYAEVCRYLIASGRKGLEEYVPANVAAKGCPGILPRVLDPAVAPTAGRQANGTVTKVRVDGDQGFIVFRAPGAELYQMTMVRENDEWRTSTLIPAVLVPSL